MVNCRFHHNIDVIKLLQVNKVNYKFLPQYVSQLNPIDEYFGELKSNYKVIMPLSKNSETIKFRVTTLLANRNNNFVKNYERSKKFLLKAAANQLFI